MEPAGGRLRSPASGHRLGPVEPLERPAQSGRESGGSPGPDCSGTWAQWGPAAVGQSRGPAA
eukprot:4595135-Alexandrium_andersonii.AAC.1